MGPELYSGRRLNVEADYVEPPFSGNFRVELTKRARGGVAWICEQRLLLRLAFLVELAEYPFRHIHLAANNKVLRRAFELQRKRTDRAEILRHVLAYSAVASRCTLHKDAVFVSERDGEPVDLRLNVKLEASDALGASVIKGLDLIGGEYIL